MSKALISWVGDTDLRAVNEGDRVGLGPIARAVSELEFDFIFLLSNYPKVRVTLSKMASGANARQNRISLYKPLNAYTFWRNL